MKVPQMNPDAGKPEETYLLTIFISHYPKRRNLRVVSTPFNQDLRFTPTSTGEFKSKIV